MDEAKTKYFKNSLGAFQGGGCKALSFIGAYGEAYRRGVFFSEVAGTSAGSLVAALIAAGASPAKLKDIAQTTKFTELLHSVEPEISFYGERILTFPPNLEP